MTDDVVVNITVGAGAISGFTFNVPIFVVNHAHSANRQDGPFSSLSELTDFGFSTSDSAYLWAQALIGQRPRPQQFLIGREDALDANMAATLQAVHDAGPGNFYAMFLASRLDADILALAAFVEPLLKIGFAQSSDPDLLTDTAGNIGKQLAAAGTYHNTSLWYHDTDTEFVDGGIGGRGLGVDLERIQPAYSHRPLNGIARDDLSTSEKNALEGDGANYYAPKVMSSGQEIEAYTFPGNMLSGRPIEQTISIHWLQARLEEVLHGVFLRHPDGVPFDDAGFGLMEAAAEGVFTRGLAAGHLVARTSEFTGRRTPWLDVVPLAEVTSTDEADSKIRMSGEVHIGKKARRVVLNVTANV